MDRITRIFQLRDEMEHMQGYRVIQEHDILQLSLYTFEKNYDELNSLLIQAESEMIFNMFEDYRNHDKLEITDMEIVRLLHNFVAASLSLIDHTRRLYERLYKSDNRFSDYEQRKNQDFVHDPLAQFVKGLRQYCQHYQSPNLQYTINWPESEQEEKLITLTLEHLQAFDGWNKAAKEYLATIKKEVHIRDVVTKYRTKVIAFYDWFHQRQRTIHADEVEQFMQKQAEILLLQLDGQLDMLLGRDDGGFNPDYIFFNIFSPQEIRFLESIPLTEPRHVDTAIMLLEAHFSVPDSMKDRIRTLYQKLGPTWLENQKRRTEGQA